MKKTKKEKTFTIWEVVVVFKEMTRWGFKSYAFHPVTEKDAWEKFHEVLEQPWCLCSTDNDKRCYAISQSMIQQVGIRPMEMRG